jgi:hypothetical protein
MFFCLGFLFSLQNTIRDTVPRREVRLIPECRLVTAGRQAHPTVKDLFFFFDHSINPFTPLSLILLPHRRVDGIAQR